MPWFWTGPSGEWHSYQRELIDLLKEKNKTLPENPGIWFEKLADTLEKMKDEESELARRRSLRNGRIRAVSADSRPGTTEPAEP